MTTKKRNLETEFDRLLAEYFDVSEEDRMMEERYMLMKMYSSHKNYDKDLSDYLFDIYLSDIDEFLKTPTNREILKPKIKELDKNNDFQEAKVDLIILLMKYYPDIFFTEAYVMLAEKNSNVSLDLIVNKIIEYSVNVSVNIDLVVTLYSKINNKDKFVNFLKSSSFNDKNLIILIKNFILPYIDYFDVIMDNIKKFNMSFYKNILNSFKEYVQSADMLVRQRTQGKIYNLAEKKVYQGVALFDSLDSFVEEVDVIFKLNPKILFDKLVVDEPAYIENLMKYPEEIDRLLSLLEQISQNQGISKNIPAPYKSLYRKLAYYYLGILATLNPGLSTKEQQMKDFLRAEDTKDAPQLRKRLFQEKFLGQKMTATTVPINFDVDTIVYLMKLASSQ